MEVAPHSQVIVTVRRHGGHSPEWQGSWQVCRPHESGLLQIYSREEARRCDLRAGSVMAVAAAAVAAVDSAGFEGCAARGAEIDLAALAGLLRGAAATGLQHDLLARRARRGVARVGTAMPAGQQAVAGLVAGRRGSGARQIEL